MTNQIKSFIINNICLINSFIVAMHVFIEIIKCVYAKVCTDKQIYLYKLRLFISD